MTTMHHVLKLAFAIALALPAAANAEEFTTSQGMKHLPPALSLVTEAQLQSASTSAEQTLVILMRDIAEKEKERRAVAAQASGVAERVGSDREAIERLRADYEQVDQQYRSQLDAFQDQQVALEGETDRQRTQAAALQAVPSAERDINEVQRLNAWADQLAQKRQQMETDRNTLMATRQTVEDKRTRLASAKAEADARLRDSRSGVLASSGKADAGMAAVANELRACVAYLDRIRSYYPTRTKKQPPKSPLLDQARQLLARLDAMH
jgi:chromosome segregation ATPase